MIHQRQQSNDENIDPHGTSKLPQPSSKLVPPTQLRKSLEERQNGNSSAMPPPRATKIRGRSKVELSGISQNTVRKGAKPSTGIPRPQSANGHHREHSASGTGSETPRHQRTSSESSTEDHAYERIRMLEDALGKSHEQKEQHYLAEIRRLKTEASEWGLTKKKLEDNVQDLLEKIQQERDSNYERECHVREELQRKIHKLEERVSELQQDKIESTGNLKLELTNKTVELKQQMAEQLEQERMSLRRQLEQEQQSVIARKDEEIEHTKARSEQDRAEFQERYNQEVQRLKDLLEQEKQSQQETYRRQLHQLEQEAWKAKQSESEKYDQKLRQLNDTLEAERAKKEEIEQRLEMAHSQEKKRINEELESESKRSKTLMRQLEEAQEQLQSEKHETATLRNALAELSASSVSIESVAKGQQTQIDELQYQLDGQKQKASEMRAIAQQAEEARDLAKSKLLKEEILRRKLHNQVQELKGNIRVFCRVRPVLEHEGSDAAQIEFPDKDEGGQEIMLASSPATTNGTGSGGTKKVHPFQFDKVFSPESTNEEVFDEISQLVQSSLDGYNVCIFAYGQTGSGKTYTMSADNDGMIPRAVNQIFQTAESMKERGWTYELEGQCLEIYNENLNDLLGKTDMLDRSKLEIRHDAKEQKTTVTDLTTVPLSSPEQVSQVLKRAWKNRSVAATRVNERSSRSHSVFILKIRGSNSITGKSHEGTLNLIDLAGSERLAQSQVTGDRLKETQAINKSLSALGDVIYSLGTSKEGGHVPYRNSKLTYLLQYSLSGNSKTLMFVNVSPLEPHANESISSLRFATKVNNTKIKK